MFNISTFLGSTIVSNQISSRVAQLLIIVSLASTFHFAEVHAQTVQWTKYRDDQTTASVSPVCNYQGSDRNFAKDNAGNLFVAGGASETGQGAVIYKFNAATGALVWRKNYVGAGNRSDCATSIAVDSVGNVAVTGYTSTQYGVATNFVAKYNGITGVLLWNVVTGFTSSQYQYGYIPSALAIDASGNIIVTNLGTTKYAGQTGAELWTTRTPIGNGASGEAIVVDANGDAYLTGQNTIKLSGASGAELWNVATSSDAGKLIGRAIRLTSDNELVVTGDAGYGFYDNSEIVTVKFSRQTGAVIWNKRFAPANSRQGKASDVTVDSFGNILVTGFVAETSPPSGNIYGLTTLKYAFNGTLLWSVFVQINNLGTPEGAAIGRAVIADPNGNVFVTGSYRLLSTPTTTQTDQWITLKFDGTTGAERWRNTYNAPTGQSDGAGVAINFDTANDPIVLGYTSGSNYSKTIRVLSYTNVSGTLKSEISSNLIDAPSEAQSIAVDNSSNLIVAGISVDQYGIKALTTKYDSNIGQELWGTTTYVASSPIVASTANGDAILAATSRVLGILIEKYASADGRLLWGVVSDRATVGFPKAIVTDASGDIYITGSTYPISDQYSYSARTIKLSSATGAELWKVSNSGVGGTDNAGMAIKIAPDGNVIVATTVSELVQQNKVTNVRVEKYDRSNGTTLWSSVVGSVDGSFGGATKIAVDAFGNVFVAALIPSSLDGGYFINLRVTKYDGATGALIWATSQASSNASVALALDVAGNPIVGHRSLVTKFDKQTGSKIWSAPFSGYDLTNIGVLDSGQVVASGASTGSSSQKDVLVMLYSGTTGLPLWTYEYDGGASANDDLNAVAVKGSSIFLAGRAQRVARKPNWFVQKLNVSTLFVRDDLSADGKSDLLFRNASTGQISAWLMNGVASTTTAGLVPPGNWTVSHTADFNGDGRADILYRNDDGSVTLWLMNGLTVTGSVGLLGPNPDWRVSHVGDFNGDGKADLLWRNVNGAVTLWLMDGTTVTSSIGLIGADPNWSVSHVADLNGDGKADLLWRNTNGAVTAWLMNGTTIASTAGLLGADPNWRISHVADFDGDGKADLLWRNNNGAVTAWLMNGTTITSTAGLLGPDANWRVSHTGDFNGDGKADLLWRNTNGAVTQWLMNGTAITSTAGLLGPDANWRVTHIGDYNGDGKADLVWRNASDGAITMWLMSGAVTLSATGILGATTWSVVPPMP